MRRALVGLGIFLGAAALAAALYLYTSPETLPWMAGDPLQASRYWRGLLRVLDGRGDLLARGMAAVAGGLLGALANRYFGWRVGVAAAVVWITAPWVWNGAVLGRGSVVLASGAVMAAWALNIVGLLVSRTARMLRRWEDEPDEEAEDVERFRFIRPRELAWAFLGFAGIFAFGSAWDHDRTLGRAAGIYAKGIVAEAAGRIIVLNGAADAQIEREVGRVPPEEGTVPRGGALSLERGATTNFVAWVRRTWPGETNLLLAAEIGREAFARAALRRFPDRFYPMTGRATTAERWWGRWQEVEGFAASCDPFVPVMRRAFAVEGNAVGNALQAAGRPEEAWRVYWRIFTEIEPENAAAVVNLEGMLRGGYRADDETRARVEGARSVLARRLGERGTAPGRARAAAGRKETLVAWSNEMIEAYGTGDLGKAAQIARAILGRRDGRGYRPAFAVLGADFARRGDYAMGEVCYRVAVEGAGADEPRAALFNDYADTLRHLGRLGEAERQARRALEAGGETAWLCQVTLAEILRDAHRNQEEVRALVDAALAHAPAHLKAEIRRSFGR